MKMLVSVLCLLSSLSASANSFDNFIGTYKAIGKPTIQNQNAKFCNRFNFKNISGLEIAANTTGYKQSHYIKILNPNGFSGYPVSDYRELSDLSPYGVYAITTGSNDFATNESGGFGGEEILKLTLSVKKNGSNYIFSMVEALLVRGTVKAACYYEVGMQK